MHRYNYDARQPMKRVGEGYHKVPWAFSRASDSTHRAHGTPPGGESLDFKASELQNPDRSPANQMVRRRKEEEGAGRQGLQWGKASPVWAHGELGPDHTFGLRQPWRRDRWSMTAGSKQAELWKLALHVLWGVRSSLLLMECCWGATVQGVPGFDGGCELGRLDRCQEERWTGRAA